MRIQKFYQSSAVSSHPSIWEPSEGTVFVWVHEVDQHCIQIAQIDFLDEFKEDPEEITINGTRYKLVPIE